MLNRIRPQAGFLLTGWLVLPLLGAVSQFWAGQLWYDRAQIMQAPWRWLGGQLVHLDWRHYGMNMAAWLLLPLTLPLLKAHWASLFAVTSAWPLSLLLYVLYPDVGIYAGWSGWLHGLYALAAGYTLRRQPHDLIAWIVLAGVGAKVLWESWQGSLNPWAGFRVATEVHAWGLVLGLMTLIVMLGTSLYRTAANR